MDQICLDPQDKLSRTPHPSDTATKHPPPQDKKVPAAHPPEDNFWNSPDGLWCLPILSLHKIHIPNHFDT